MNNLFNLNEEEKSRILNLHESRKPNHGTALLTEQKKDRKDERLKKFNELIKLGDDKLKNVIHYRLTFPKGVDSVLDWEFKAKHFEMFNSTGSMLIEYEEEIIQKLNASIELYNQAKSLYTNPKVVKKKRLVGTPEEVENNLSLVDEKINKANSYLTKYNNLLPKLKEIKSQADKSRKERNDKKVNSVMLKAGLQKVSEIDVADGTYDSADSSPLPNGPKGIWNLYIVDANNKWTGYLFIPKGGSMPRSGPRPQLEIKGKQVTTRPGTLWYKSSQSTNENYSKLVTTNLINEQNTEFLDGISKKLIDKGYKEVDSIPDGKYRKGGWGYNIKLSTTGGIPTGYSLVVTNGIRGQWSGTLAMKDSQTNDANLYKIFYNEDLKEEAPPVGGRLDKQKLLYKAFDSDNLSKYQEADIDTIIEILKKYKGKLDLNSDKYGKVGEPFGL